MIKNSKTNTYVFIDAANIIYGAKETGRWKVDFPKLFKYLTERFKAKKIFFYTGYNPHNKKQINNISKLEEIGFIVRSKPIKIIKQDSVYKKNTCPSCKHIWTATINRPPKIKSNCDVDLTLDATNLSEKYKTGIFFTGDGDFVPLFKFLLQNKHEIKIFGAVKRTAIDIRQNFKSMFIDLNQIKHLVIQRQKKRADTLEVAALKY